MTGADTARTATAPAGDSYPYDAVLLAGFGGPERQQDVLPFLRNVTAGRGIPDERLAEVGRHYEALGGASPINEQTDALRAALQAELVDRGIALPVLWGNRNWNPYLTDTVAAAGEAGRRRLLAVTTSAYSSYSSCRQYREDFAAALAGSGTQGTVTIDKVRPYFDQPGFLEPFADGAARALREALAGGLTADEMRVVFTTHSIPTVMADTSGSAALGEHGDGGAYVAQHLAAARYVAEQIAERVPQLGGELRWQLAFQSRSGSPRTPWLEPDVNDVLTGLAAVDVHGVIVVPIGFVSDHVEVIWDLDREAADTAAGLGLRFWRVATPGTDARFVSALADLIAARVGRGLPHEPVLAMPTRPLACAPGCCANPRGVLPTTSGQDSDDDVAAAERAAGSAGTAAGHGLRALRPMVLDAGGASR